MTASTPINIPCPNCRFALIVTNRRILGRRARCPKCQHKFVLEAPAPAETVATSCDSDTHADESHANESHADSVPSEQLLVDQGRAYVSMDQIERWHSEDERQRFMQWIMKKTTTLAADGMGFFLEDYDEWRGLDQPAQK